jgi:hypothetical protein
MRWQVRQMDRWIQVKWAMVQVSVPIDIICVFIIGEAQDVYCNVFSHKQGISEWLM